MRAVLVLLVLAAMGVGVNAEDHQGPTNPKAQKTFSEAKDWLRQHKYGAAVGSFRKADEQDGGHCEDCAWQIIKYGLEVGDYKDADAAAQQLIADAKDPLHIANARMERATVEVREGLAKNDRKSLSMADQEYQAVIAIYPKTAEAYFFDGVALAHLRDDDAARARFQKFLSLAEQHDDLRPRAQRYLENPELARARMAPAFTVTTLNGQDVSLDGLAGKVVLIDFWATWCGPCREDLTQIRDIAREFKGEPLVVISVSLDKDEAKWKAFVAKNDMTWLQCRDASGDMARLFAVRAIPRTFMIDADGVLQDERGGYGGVDSELRRLCARARSLQGSPKVAMQNPSGN